LPTGDREMKYDKKNYIQLHGDLFQEVQGKGVFQDSKTFVDSIPKNNPEIVLEKFFFERRKASFNLKEFVLDNFILPEEKQVELNLPKNRSMSEHLQLLWEYLKRGPSSETSGYSSLIPLKHEYIIPGGRFREVYYWDSYFTMLGLVTSGEIGMVENMINNFAFLIEQFGFIPNGNRVYYLTRSQPPFYSLMLKLLSKYKKEKNWITNYLTVLEKEYSYWMQHSENKLSENRVDKHVVLIKGNKLNRHYDSDNIPREESYSEDVLTYSGASEELKKTIYQNIRSAAETGWDFSSRWFSDFKTLSTVYVEEIAQIDLNCLLCHLEETLSEIYSLSGNEIKSAEYRNLYNTRRSLINEIFWNIEEEFYFDYNFVSNEHIKVYSAAALYPLFLNIAEKEIAEKVSRNVEKYLLRDGGIVTSTNNTGQQWDSPNGWPPLQWVAIKGLRNYGLHELADKIKTRWHKLNERVFMETGKMFEKYNVENPNIHSGGGEYPLQDGFGWTNGVALALLRDLDHTL